MAQLHSKPLAWFKRDPRQPRKLPDNDADLTPEQRAEFINLGNSLKKKQLQALLCLSDGTIIAGERRYRAARLVGMETLEVKIADEPLTESQIRAWQLVENMQREDLSAYEQWTATAELMCMNPLWQMKDCAEALNLTPSQVTRILSPSKCIEAVQNALRDRKIGIAAVYSISKQSHLKQAGLLALKLSGATRDEVEAAGRKPREPKAAAERAQRLKCDLPGGVSVVVSGQGVSIDDSIEALGTAIKEMKRARELGYTAKTFAAAMRDKAKAV